MGLLKALNFPKSLIKATPVWMFSPSHCPGRVSLRAERARTRVRQCTRLPSPPTQHASMYVQWKVAEITGGLLIVLRGQHLSAYYSKCVWEYSNRSLPRYTFRGWLVPMVSAHHSQLTGQGICPPAPRSAASVRLMQTSARPSSAWFLYYTNKRGWTQNQ